MALSKEEKKRRSEERRLERFNKNHKTVDGIVYKQCSYHKDYFPNEDDWFPSTEEYFYKNSTSTGDGLHPECKKCSMKKATEWANENREIYLAGIRRNNAKPEIKEQIREAARKQREEGKQKEWRQNNREKTREYVRNRGQKNHKINNKEWEACLKYFNYECAYCGMTLEEHKQKYNQQLHKEHVIHNGLDDLSNCIPSCYNCNSQKWEFTLDKWYNESNSNFTQERLDKIYQWLNEDYKLYIEPPKPKGKYTKKNKEYWENKGGLN